MFKESIWFGFIMLLLPILITSCVITPAYRYRWWEYEPIDYNTLHPNLQPEHVYIPRYRPQPIYQYENVWYSEPYTILIYEDNTGYRIRQKVPNSLLRMQLNKDRPYLRRSKGVRSIMQRVKKKRRELHLNNQKRTKVLERIVDINSIRKRRRINQERNKNEAMGKT